MPEKIAFSIISPMFNEEENVESTVGSVRGAMKDFPGTWELILVNDGSTDGTLDVARRRLPGQRHATGDEGQVCRKVGTGTHG